MNINELDKDIKKHEIKSPETYNDIIKLTIPFYMVNRKLIEGISALQEDNFQINNTELDVLASLKISGGDKYVLSPTKLNERLLFTSGAITKVLKKLEEKKLITRLDNKFDKRSKLVVITDLGLDIVNKALKAVTDLEAEYFSVLTETEKETMKELLIKILKGR